MVMGLLPQGVMTPAEAVCKDSKRQKVKKTRCLFSVILKSIFLDFSSTSSLKMHFFMFIFRF